MTLKSLRDYGRGLEMSEKRAKGVKAPKKSAKTSDVHTVKAEAELSKTRTVAGVEKITFTKGDLVQL